MKKGKLIVLYGVNNLGKSTQAELLLKRIVAEGRKAKLIKVPVYDLDPTGRMLNEYLREGNPGGLTDREAQLVYAYNRQQFLPQLEKDLKRGINVILEDYWGTGVAWGMGNGIDKDFLLKINKQFQNEDLAILFFGERFLEAAEKNHKHETDDALTDRVAAAHEELADEFGWKRINANQSIQKAHDDIWEIVTKII